MHVTYLRVCADFQRWRLLCLAFGFFTLLLAPVVSSWVPFYYSSSMAIGVFLVILIILFQVFDSFLFLFFNILLFPFMSVTLVAHGE